MEHAKQENEAITAEQIDLFYRELNAKKERLEKREARRTKRAVRHSTLPRIASEVPGRISDFDEYTIYIDVEEVECFLLLDSPGGRQRQVLVGDWSFVVVISDLKSGIGIQFGPR